MPRCLQRGMSKLGPTRPVRGIPAEGRGCVSAPSATVRCQQQARDDGQRKRNIRREGQKPQSSSLPDNRFLPVCNKIFE